MGLDAVGIVLRCEEVFGITISDDDASQVSTVGDLNRLICSGLGLPTDLRFPIPDELPKLPPGSWERPAVIKLNLNPPPAPHWTPERVWNTTVAILCDQMQLPPNDLYYDARLNADLGRVIK